MHEFNNKPKSSKVTDLLKKLEDHEGLVFILVKNILSKIAENSNIKNNYSNFLKNLSQFYLNVDDILGLNADVLIYLLHSINTLASKNSGEVRSAMKSEKLFEFRDKLLMQLLRFDLKSTSLYNILKDFSFEALANQSKFRESHTIAYLIKILIQTKDYLNLQLLILRILKQDIAISDENIKYVTKIIESPTILIYLYPNYK
mmetsp:Transcript_30779/g.28003  ORF Transcript_30779/g.28003 Transcript_30779/m.28003 type:complete len:202 (+) Transcript_30779:3497-4102(+)